MNKKVKAVLWYLFYLAIAVVVFLVVEWWVPRPWNLPVTLVTSFAIGYLGMTKALEVWTEEE